MNQGGPTRHGVPGSPNSYTTSRDTTVGNLPGNDR
jgi:hypothetical protein